VNKGVCLSERYCKGPLRLNFLEIKFACRSVALALHHKPVVLACVLEFFLTPHLKQRKFYVAANATFL